MSVKILSVAKQLPKHTRETKDIIPFVKLWMQGQETRFQRKVLKLFEGAGVDRRYSIMDAEEVFLNSSFEDKNKIYVREVTTLAEQSLKKSLENYWQGKIKQEELKITAKDLRKKNWELQKESGIKFIPSNDFSFYDHVLDLTAMVGAVPKRYNFSDDKVDLDLYFAMARGAQNEKNDVVAMEMTKWFDTNYHYIVPEFSKETKFKLASTKIIDEYLEAKKLDWRD